MHPDSGFQHRLAAQTYRFLQRHPQVEHLEVVVITPHQRHKLGPAQLPRHLRVFLAEVHWISQEKLSQQPDLDPLLNLLTLPVRPESELAASSQQILASRPDLDTVVLPMLVQRFPQLTEEEIMVIAGIPREAAKMTLRLLNRRCGPLSEATTAQIQALPVDQLEAPATWLAANA